jgi:beta-1,4-mannosyl-glycoprotein beta-1,4-N-acetylglucosaminyltransferase
MFFDEEQILDLRLNVLNEKVDFFVIVESIYNHRGEKRELIFNKNNFSKFKDKIIYLVHTEIPEQVETINQNDNENEKNRKYIMNAVYRENSQRNYISEGIKTAKEDDLIFISDVDEIPKFENINIHKIKNKLIMFRQNMFHYRYNLALPNFKWTGTKAVRKKNLISPQWLRNTKDRNYPIYRIDTFFSKKKYSNIKIIEDGGWHFSNIKTPKMLNHKFKSYLHHIEFDKAKIDEDEIKNLINKKQAVYNLGIDKRGSKVGNGEILENFDIKNLPEYIQKNIYKYKDWLN